MLHFRVRHSTDCFRSLGHGVAKEHGDRMSEQPLDFRRFLQIVRRNLTFIGIAAALGLLVGAGYAELYPPMHESTAVVVLPSSTNNTPAEMVVASSNPVLADALSGVR